MGPAPNNRQQLAEASQQRHQADMKRKRAKVCAVTPWISASEQQQQHQQESLASHVVWSIRWPRLPHAVASTHALQTLEYSHTDNTDVILKRMAYATAIVRAVNGLTDVDRSLQQQSVAQQARNIGLPAWLVEIRHSSTHNALPSIDVLRMAASTLLIYWERVYWQPVREQRQRWQQEAERLLNVYQQNSDCKDGSEQINHGVTLGGDSSLAQVADEGKEPPKVDQPTRLGTFANSFALLQKPSKKARKEAEVAAQEQESLEHERRREVRRVARQLARLPCPAQQDDVPWDVRRQVLLDHLVGRMPPIYPPGGEATGVLLHSDTVRVRYLPLIREVLRQWPGFLTALLIRLVDHAVHNCNVESCVGWLLSPYFLQQVGNKTRQSGVENTLLHFQVPLNSLCDRCDEAEESSVAKSKLLPIVEAALGETNRVKNNGCDFETTPSRVESLPVQQPNKTPQLSLEDMENLLSDSPEQEQRGADAPSSVGGSSPRRRQVWVQCQSWDACSIGSLPGHALPQFP